MEDVWKNSYNLLKAELSELLGDGWPTEKRISGCFQVCQRHIDQVRILAGKDADSAFFRQNILVHFLAEAEFVANISFAHIFCAKDVPEEYRLFIEREKLRFARFQQRYKDVISEYKLIQPDEELVFDPGIEPNAETILSGFLAFKKYIAFLESKI